MNNKSFIATMLFMAIGTTTALAQKFVLYLSDNQEIKLDIMQIDSIKIEEDEAVNVHEWVDLGLPSGTLWATCNIGANRPEDYGDYFAWGETEPKDEYSYSTYKYCSGSHTSFTKYCTSREQGTFDGKTILEPMDDAATANWGSDWKMPSEAQLAELYNRNYTYTEWTSMNGVNGERITSKRNGNSIFLPAEGCRMDSNLAGVGSYGYYWASSLRSGESLSANVLDFDADGIGMDGSSGSREYGRGIRPVRVEVHYMPKEGNLTCNFENYHLDESNKYYVWEAPSIFIDETGNSTWKNGNPGFKLSRSSAQPMDYPSTPVDEGGPDGSACVKLETCDTGPFGKMVNMRLASGSMFNGFFDVGKAIKDPLGATLFGSPFAYKPVQLNVWLRYEPGDVYQDHYGNTIADVIDEPDIFIVVYRNEDESGNEILLDGNDVLTNPYIVGIGRLQHRFNTDGSDMLTDSPIHGITSTWQKHVIPVKYFSTLDETLLESEGYSMAICFASSWQGSSFKGAIGSKLFIDNMQVICE